MKIEFTVNLVRLARAKCPICLRRRVLYRLAAFGNDHPVGFGESACATCAGLRR